MEAATPHQFTKYTNYLINSLNQIEPDTAMTNQPEESKYKYSRMPL